MTEFQFELVARLLGTPGLHARRRAGGYYQGIIIEQLVKASRFQAGDRVLFGEDQVQAPATEADRARRPIRTPRRYRGGDAFPRPLTHDELRAIRERQPWNPDVLTLLWEVKRLRSMMLRAYQLSGEFHRPVGVLANCYDEYMAQLVVEPCVLERDADVAEMLNAPAQPRKG